MTTTTADADLYVDTCLSRSLEALGLEEASDVIGTPIPIDFEEPLPVSVRISRAALVVSTPGRDHRVTFARIGVALCAMVAVGSAAMALAKSPVSLKASAKQLVRVASVDLVRR